MRFNYKHGYSKRDMDRDFKNMQAQDMTSRQIIDAKRERQEARRYRITTAIAILALIVSIIALLKK